MDDKEIISRFIERSESAITAISEKYSKYCRVIAINILGDTEDAEEEEEAPLAGPAEQRSHRQNIIILTGAGLLDTALETWFSDPDRMPDTAEAVMLLANLYNSIRQQP